MRFPIAFGRFGFILRVTGLPQRSCWVDVGASETRVKMGWAFAAVIPNASIESAERFTGSAYGSIGAHGWRGRWLVNGTTANLVAIHIVPEVKARAVFPVKLRELVVSVDDPDGFIETLGQLVGGSS